jgi:hypothetical protein
VPTTGRARQGDDRGAARRLPESATYGDLVALARSLEDRGASDSEAGCLLGAGTSGGWVLAADLAPAVRPLPEPPQDHAEFLRAERGPVRVLTRWGGAGPRSAALAVATITSAVPPAPGSEGAVVFLVPEGALLRSTIGPAPPRAGAGPAPPEAPVPIAALGAALAALGLPAPRAPIVVAAEARTRLADVRAALRAVEATGAQVQLGVALPPGTALPADPVVAPDAAARGLCPNGLRDLPPDAAEGDIDVRALRAALGALSGTASRCLGTAGPAGSGGGRFELAVRLAPEGRVAEACATLDSAGDPALRACVLEAVRGLDLPRPSPAGFVDLAFPLVLSADATAVQRASCD